MPDTTLRPLERRVGPVTFHDISATGLADYIVGNAGRGKLVFYLNAHGLNLFLKDPQFAGVIRQADLCFCDGFGVVLLTRLFSGQKVSHRITGPDYLAQFYDRVAAAGRSLYLLGDTPEVITSYAAYVREKVGPCLVGHHHGYILDDPEATRRVLDEIDRLKPSILLLGMGMPRQEQWAVTHRGHLKDVTCVALGAAFAWGANTGRRRGPRWATDRGLEWFFRLLNEPGLVWKRYLLGLPEVFLRLLLWHLRRLRPCAPR